MVYTQKKCNLKWSSAGNIPWHANFPGVRRSNILQTQDYAQTLIRVKHQSVRHAVLEIDGKEAGQFQVFETKILGGLLHQVMLDRGPLWYAPYGSLEDFAAFLREYDRIFPKRPGRRRRLIPEMPKSPELTQLMAQHHFKPAGSEGCETIWVDLSANEEKLFGEIKKNQRTAIRKAEKSGVSVEWDESGKMLPWILKRYELDQRRRSYPGPSTAFLKALTNAAVQNNNVFIARALRNNKPIAAILVLRHGRSATYQIGWTGDEGRKFAAHPFLLWEAYKKLKSINILDFDLGGVNDQSAKSIKAFKQAMGGELVRLAPLYT